MKNMSSLIGQKFNSKFGHYVIIIKYNNVFDGGKAARDVSLIYGCWPFSRGSEIRYNWVHGCNTDGWDGEKGDGGMGIRADDQSRNNIIHHNVVWNIGGE